MSVQILAQQVILTFLMIGVGYISIKVNIFSGQASKIFSNFIMMISLPCTLLSSTNVNVDRTIVFQMFMAFVIQMIFYLISTGLCFLVIRQLKIDKKFTAIIVAVSVMPNCAFIGIPLCTELVDANSAAIYGASAIMAFNVFFFTFIQSLFQKQDGFQWKKMISPTTVATMIMVIMFLFGIHLPGIAVKFCSTIGNCTTPLAMSVIGIMLAGSDIKKVFSNRLFYLITMLRNFVFPLLLMLVMRGIGLEKNMFFSILILCACPAASLSAVLAKQYEVEPELCSQAVIHSTLFIAISVPVMLWISNLLF